MAARTKKITAGAPLLVMKSGKGRKPGVTDKVLARYDALDAIVQGVPTPIMRSEGVTAYTGFVLPEDFVAECKTGLNSIVANWATSRGHTRSLHNEQVSPERSIVVLELK